MCVCVCVCVFVRLFFCLSDCLYTCVIVYLPSTFSQLCAKAIIIRVPNREGKIKTSFVNPNQSSFTIGTCFRQSHSKLLTLPISHQLKSTSPTKKKREQWRSVIKRDGKREKREPQTETEKDTVDFELELELR